METYKEMERKILKYMVVMTVILAILVFLLFSVKGTTYSVVPKGNGSFYLYSTEWDGARVFENCFEEHDCTFQVEKPTLNVSCSVEDEKITKNITQDLKKYIHDRFIDHQSWQSGVLSGKLENSTRKEINKLEEYFDTQVMPKKKELEDCILQQNKLDSENRLFQEKYLLINKTFSELTSLQKTYANDTITELQRQNQYLREKNTQYLWLIIFAIAIIAGLAGFFHKLRELKTGVRTYFHKD